MTTRLEIEHAAFEKGRRRIHRETLFEVEDRKGAHETQFGSVQLDVKHQRLCYTRGLYSFEEPGPHGLYWLEFFYNEDIVIDASQAPELAAKLKAPIRRISVGGDGNGSQQIGREVTLFVHTDLFRREKR